MKNGMKRLISMLLCLVMVLQLLPASVFAIDPPKGPHDGLILEFKDQTELVRFRMENGGEILGGNMLLIDGYYEDAARYERMEGIVSVTYNYTFETAGFADEYSEEPDDPYFAQQPYPGNKATWFNMGVNADNIEGFAFTTIRVAVLDTGIDGTHEDLASRVVAGYDAANDAPIAAGVNSEIAYDSHGTMVAGLIGAEAYNGKGIAGVAGKFPVELVPVRALGADGKGKIADIVRGIYWCIDNDIDIINMSFGTRLNYYPAALGKAVDAADECGIMMIAAAGNESGKTFEGYYPAGLEKVYAVVSASGINSSEPAEFSNQVPYNMKDFYYAGFKYSGCYGTDLWTTAAGNQYVQFTGTSASCAVLTGYWALMSVLTGGRDNPFARYDMGYAVNRGMPGQYGNRNYYNINVNELNYAISSNITPELIALKDGRITASLTCETLMSKQQQIVATVQKGEAAVLDATLAVYDAAGEQVYISDPIANDGSNPTTYTFTLDTTALADGDAKIKVFFRNTTQTEYIPENSKNVVSRDVIIKNSLAPSYATVHVYDAEGNEIYADVQVIDPATGKVIQTISYDKYSNTYKNTVNRATFNDGQLTFAIYGDGFLYEVTTGFQADIDLGAEAQTTDIIFRNSAVTLANAKVYAQTPVGMKELGTTNEEGELSVSMTAGTFRLFVADTQTRYLISGDAVQDGNQLEISMASAISNVQAFTVAAAERLSENDFFALGVSTTEVDTLAEMTVFGWLSSKTPTINMTPGSYYMMVGIYDTIMPDSSSATVADYEYVETIHVIGQVDTTAVSSIDFDPAALHAQRIDTETEVLYGEALDLKLRPVDDKGYPIIGGNVYSYSDFGKVYDGADWNSGYNIDTTCPNGDSYYGMEYDWNWGKFDTISNWEPLPYEEGTYSMVLEYYFWNKNDWAEEKTDVLEYNSVTAAWTISVKLGPALVVELPVMTWGDLKSISTIVDGKEVPLTILSQNATQAVVSVAGLAKGAPLFLNFHGYVEEVEAYFSFYTLEVYDPDASTIQAALPAETGTFSMLAGETKLDGGSTVISTEYGDFNFFLWATNDWSTYYVPAGEYTLTGIDYAGWDEETYMDIYMAYATTVKVEAGNHTDVVLGGETLETVDVYMTEPWRTEISFQMIVDGKTIEVNPFGNGGRPSEFTLAKDSTIEDLRIVYAVPDMQGGYGSDSITGEGLEVVASVNFDGGQMEVSYWPMVEGMEAMPDANSFSTEEDATVSIETMAYGGAMRVRELNKKQYTKTFLDSDHINYELTTEVLETYKPTAHFRPTGGTWQKAEDVSWTKLNLGKLEAGEYEVLIETEENEEAGIPTMSAYCVVTVGESGGSGISHRVSVFAPESAVNAAQLTVTGTAGSAVVVHYEDPLGIAGQLEAFTMPENGKYILSLPLEREGDYTVWAESTLTYEGVSDTITSEKMTVTCDKDIPNSIKNFKVSTEGSNALRLTWDKPADAAKVWIYRDGVELGFVEAVVNDYLDTNLSTERTYTYSLVPESAAGLRGTPVYASARPVSQADTTAPTAPAQLKGEVDVTNVTLTWTRSTDDAGIAFYRVFRDGVQIAETGKRTYTDEGLTKKTTYTYTVSAVDTSGNESAQTAPVAVTTADVYALRMVSATMELNRFGDIVGSSMDIFADAGLDATRVYAEVVFIQKGADTGEQTQIVELADSGLYWRTSWDLSEILSVKSVTVHAYENETEIGVKECEGFPAVISSLAQVVVHFPNAPYAGNSAGRGQVILTDQATNMTWVKDINTGVESYSYEFSGLSASTYSVQVKLGDKTVFYEPNIGLEVGGGIYREVTIEGLIRVKVPTDQVLYRMNNGTHTRSEDGYLIIGRASAFWVDQKASFSRTVSEMYTIGGQLYRLPDKWEITRVSGTHVYSLPGVEQFEKLENFDLKVQINTPYSDTPVQGMMITVTGTKADGTLLTQTGMADENGLVTIPWPESYSKQIIAKLERCNWYDAAGEKLLATFTYSSATYSDIATDGSFVAQLDLNEERIADLTVDIGVSADGWAATITSCDKRYPVTIYGTSITIPVLWNFGAPDAKIQMENNYIGGKVFAGKTYALTSLYSKIELESLKTESYFGKIGIRETNGLNLDKASVRVKNKYGEKKLILNDGIGYFEYIGPEHEYVDGEGGASFLILLEMETDYHWVSYWDNIIKPGFYQSPPNPDNYWYTKTDENGNEKRVFNEEAFAAAQQAYSEKVNEYYQKLNEFNKNLEKLEVTADYKIQPKNLDPNFDYSLLIYSHSDTSKPCWVVTRATEETIVRYPGEDFKGFTVVILPVPKYAESESLNKKLLLETPLSAFNGWTGVDVYTVSNFIQEVDFVASPVETVELGQMTDLVGNVITDKVYAYRELNGQILYRTELAEDKKAIVYNESDFVVLVPEDVGPERYAKYKKHHAENGNQLCIVLPISAKYTKPQDVMFGYQSRYTFRLQQSDGTVREKEHVYLGLFNDHSMVIRRTGWWKGSAGEICSTPSYYNKPYKIDDAKDGAEWVAEINYPLDTHEVFGGWLSQVALDAKGELDYSMYTNYAFWKEYGAYYNLDLTVAHPEPIVLISDADGLMELDDLDTNIEAVRNDGGWYDVKVLQVASKDTDLLFRFPEGTYDTFYGNARVAAGVKLPDPLEGRVEKTDKDAHVVFFKFKIPAEDLAKNAEIQVYSVGENGTEQLQFTRQIPVETFRINYQDAMSRNEIIFSGNYPWIEEPVYPFGRNFGTEVKLLHKKMSGGEVYIIPEGAQFSSTGGSGGSSWYEYEEELNKDMTLPQYLNRTPGSALGAARSYGFAGAYVSFYAPYDDFSVAMKVDGENTIWLVQDIIDNALDDVDRDCSFALPMEAISSPIGLGSSSGSAGGSGGSVGGVSGIRPPVDTGETLIFPKEDGYIYFPSTFLEKYGLYNPYTGMGALPVGMTKPESYPHTYDIDLRFRYIDDNGEVQKLAFPEEAITVYYNAPVMTKWNWQVYHGGKTFSSGDCYNAIQSYSDRVNFKNSYRSSIIAIGDGASIYTVNAYFDKPEGVCNVFAVSNITNESSGSRFMELFYDEEKGCYTATGMLGDAANAATDISIHYDLVVDRPVNNRPAISMEDLLYNIQQEGDEGDYEISAPDNGWTLEQTYAAWEKYVQFVADGTLTDEEIDQITDENGYLYFPKINIYDENGILTDSRQDYLIFEDVAQENTFEIALVDGGEEVATLTYGYQVKDDHNFTIDLTATDGALLMPRVEDDGQVQAAVYLAAPATAGIQTMNKAVKVASDFFTTKSAYDAVNGVKDAINNDFYSRLPADMQTQYDNYRAVDALGAVAETVLGTYAEPVGVAFGVFDMIMAPYKQRNEDIYRKIADANDARKKAERMVERAELQAELARILELTEDLYFGTYVPWLPKFLNPHYGDLDIQLDPSGYVFEGSEDNRLEGVTATVYEWKENTQQWEPWYASESSGEGPYTQITDSLGQYGWDVPEGKWKVIFTKDGYFLGESAELEVPPAHLDVNVGMVATVPATITDAEITDPKRNGQLALEFTFDRPVLVSDVKKLVTVRFGDEVLAGYLEALDEGLTSNGNKYSTGNKLITEDLSVARKFRFTPNEAFPTGASVVLRADAGILTYNGMECAAYDSDFILIPQNVNDPITALTYTGATTVEVNKTLDMSKDLQKTGSAGYINWKSLTPNLATVTNTGVLTAKAAGQAIIEIYSGSVRTLVVVEILGEAHVHTEKVIPAVAATCTTAGYTEGKECATCGEILTYQQTIPATGHTMDGNSCTACDYKLVDLQLTTVTLRPGAAGLYFTGSFDIARDVEVARRGIVVSVYNELPVADGSDPRSLWTEGTTSVLVKNILSDKVGSTSNQNRAATPIYARAYVELADGSYIYSDVVVMNLREVVEAADTQWATLDAAQKEAITAMYEKFGAAMEAWNIPNLKQN